MLASVNDDTGKTELMAIAWVDRNRCFFITTTCGLGNRGMIQRKRLRQLDKSGRAPPDKVIIKVPQPKAIAKYYKGAGTIDRHNRIRAEELRLDRNLGTKHRDKRFNLGVLGVICVNAYLFFNRSLVQATGQRAALSSLEGSRTSSSAIRRGFGLRGLRWIQMQGGMVPPTQRSLQSRRQSRWSIKRVLITHRGDAAARTAR